MFNNLANLICILYTPRFNTIHEKGEKKRKECN